jgi:hypothetical protein
MGGEVQNVDSVGMRRSGDGRGGEVELTEEQSGQSDGDRQRQDHCKAYSMTAMLVGTARLDRLVNGVFHQKF